jgi:hypothetical protein
MDLFKLKFICQLFQIQVFFCGDEKGLLLKLFIKIQTSELIAILKPCNDSSSVIKREL